MRFNSRKAVGSALATVGIVAGLGVSLAGSASADNARQGGSDGVKIRAVIDGNTLAFKGPKSVEKGEKLTFVNRTPQGPKGVGPHTFSLVRKSQLPSGNDCPACNRVIKAHQPNSKGVDRPVVDVSMKGWDKRFGRRGDSFFSQEQNESHTRKVRADVGRRLFYFCAIHTDMQGKINVR